MSLSEDVRSELATIRPPQACCRPVELSAVVRTAGSVHLRGRGRVAVHLDVATGRVARRAFALLRAHGARCEIRTYRRRAVERLRAAGRLDELSPELRTLAELRVRHPTISLRELARRSRPPPTKAAMQRRLAKLRRLADG